MNQRFRLASVVEGHGDVEAVPALVHRIVRHLGLRSAVDTPEPIRQPRDQILNIGGLEHAVRLAENDLEGRGAILVLIDADQECPAQLGPHLLARAQNVRSDPHVGVVLASHEYENWLIASAESLAGRFGLPVLLTAPPDPEGIRGAKEWLSRRMPRGQRYRETRDQVTLTRLLDIDLARGRSDSFDKCVREVERLLHALRDPPG